MARMQLKLFRSTGYHSILAPGEARLAPHPGWAVAGAGAWIGFACNVWFWQALAAGGAGLARAACLGLAIGAAAAAVLSLFGWRRTIKPVATLMLLAAALLAGGAWVNAVPATALAGESFRITSLLPPWASLFRWQVPTALVVLGLLPVLVLSNVKLRRLSGSAQMRVNTWGIVWWGLLAAAAFWTLGRLPA
jgi:lipid A ethanolaminephosphotransferase